MKRIITTALLLCLLFACASAETLSEYIDDYNIYASVLGAPEIDLAAIKKYTASNGREMYTASVPGLSKFNLYADFTGCSCTGSNVETFLRTATALCIKAIGKNNAANIYCSVMSSYLFAKVDGESDLDSINDWALKITYKDGEYQIICVKYR